MSDDEERVARILEQVRAGVRQRRAETTTLGAVGIGTSSPGALGDAHGRLLALKQAEYVQEPVPTSHRRRLGRWIVLARKASYHLGLRWLVRPVLEQQNSFNQAAAASLEELVEANERLARQVLELTARLEALERNAAGIPRGSAP